MIEVMSFNLRVDVASDGINAWPFRRQRVIDFINEQNPDILALQEVNPNMLIQLKEDLSIYDFYVMPRDAGGESTPLLIKKGLGKVIVDKSIWLTDTPLIESRIPGCHFTRITTYAIIEIKGYQRFGVFNAHLDYAGDDITLTQLKHLVNYIEALKKDIDFDTIILGDFNTTPNTNTIKYMKKLYDDGYENDSNLLTFHNFKLGDKGEPIDYIFTSKGIKRSKIEIMRNDDINQIISDHYPIKIKIEE